VADPTLLDLLALEELDRDLYRSTVLVRDRFPLYGGQVAAQALRAAGATVPEGRLPHSLHGYYLRSGDAGRPVIFRVDRDRDGGSFSARRVVAVQGGGVVFSMAVSFAAPGDGPDRSPQPVADVVPPDGLPVHPLIRVLGLTARRPPQPLSEEHHPTRFWARSRVALPDDPLLHACVLTYLSDYGTGLSVLADDDVAPGPSLDHAVWFHRPARADDWVLMDMAPGSVAAGRGYYTGSISTVDGTLAASFAQESLFRRGPNPFHRLEGAAGPSAGPPVPHPPLSATPSSGGNAP
jgi:acyl-CoA thioesterase-2